MRLGLEWERLDFTRDLFTEVETPQTKQNPPRPHAAGMRFKAPTGKKLSGDGGGEKKKPKEGKRGHVMALPVWGGFPTFQVLEVVDQNLTKSTHFPHSPHHLEGKGKEGGCPRRTHRFNPLGF